MVLASWQVARFETAARVHVFDVSGRAALFDERKQALRELNQTALRIWELVSEGRSCAQVAELLQAAGASREDARSFATSAALEWLRLGFLVPEEVVRIRSGEPKSCLPIVVDGRAYLLRFHGDFDADVVIQVLGHFRSDDVEVCAWIDVVGLWGESFVFFEGDPRGMLEPRQTPPRIKAIIGGDPRIAQLEGFLVHGATLSAGGKRILLSGEPGAGKTTLSLALANAGFAYGGDDVARVYSDGLVCGVPFAAAAKPGAWPLLQSFIPDLNSLPILERDDGVLVRYVLPRTLDDLGPAPIDITVALQRESEASARTDEVDPLDALVALLDSGWSGGRHFTEASTLLAVAHNFSRARHYRLIYGDLEGAIAAVKDLVGT